jgi:hypothetical protein
MDEAMLNRVLEKQARTVNSLEDKDFRVYFSSFFRQHDALIRKNLTLLEIFKTRQGLVAQIFYKFRAITTCDQWEPTRLTYGRRGILYVPRDFCYLTETILSMNCREQGVFRTKNSAVSVEQCISILQECIGKNMSLGETSEVLREKFSVIDLTAAFKELLRMYEATIIPAELISIMYKIARLRDEEDQIVLCHLIFVSIPKSNRHVLEATIQFLYTVHDIATDNGTDYRNNMNMEGFSTIMMPNLILRPNLNLNLEQVNLLVKFMRIFIMHFESIVRLDKDVLELNG